MPTGYTDKITDTMTLLEFALECAKAFFHDGCIKTEADTSWNDEHIADCLSKIAYLQSATDAQLAEEIRLDNAENEAITAKAIAEDVAERARYERMLALVKDWRPPHADLKGLKDFMVQQITSSIEFDCHDEAWHREGYGNRRQFKGTPAEYRAREISRLQKDVDYRREENVKEMANAAKRAEFMRLVKEIKS